MRTNNQRPHNRFVPRSLYQEQQLAEAMKQWCWSEWQLAKLRVDKGNAPTNYNEEEVIEWHRRTTIR